MSPIKMTFYISHWKILAFVCLALHAFSPCLGRSTQQPPSSPPPASFPRSPSSGWSSNQLPPSVSQASSSYMVGYSAKPPSGPVVDMTMNSMDRRESSSLGYTNPSLTGGQMLTIVNETYPAGLGEPLNMIISANSDAAVLVDSADNGGLRNYYLSLNFSGNCLNIISTGGQYANLGDGKDVVIQTAEIRYNFGDAIFGTCRETFQGGNHFRYWTQATTGAIFMAASEEMDLAQGHDIVSNGYNLGRDGIVGYATTGGTTETVVSRNVTNSTVLQGSTSYNNYTYTTTVQYVSGLLQNSSEGINHMYTVEEDGYPAIDGLVAVMTVKITGYPPASSGAGSFSPRASITLVTIVSVMLSLSILDLKFFQIL
ncbi:hypothetical protein [Phaffia rhodozyma]|uniref:Uncharacterized protein n=1 Tax=Phaffia rhodozyma TaxID=264483 RepID=A0A0F7SQS2_PHARH|nr:hypothetical protein [Phaffia rhodozyma]